MADDRFRLHRRAQIAINELPAEEGDQVLSALDSLTSKPPAKWPAYRAQVFPSDKSLYLVRVNPSVRVILRVADGQPYKVLDVVRQETLDSFAKMAADAEE
jgi:hypothetical protein